jgi:predicted ArsR family transcriptional regulator
MKPTRERVLGLVVERREARVEDLASELAITPAAVRRHLDNLRADGLVDVRGVRQATGRPYHVYYPTERARGSLPPAYARLLMGMLSGLGDRPDVVDDVLGAIAESVAEKHRTQVGGAADEASRVALVTGSLRGEGILDTWRVDADGFHLVNGSCPYIRAAEVSKLPCECDRKTIELLLGVEVQQVHRIVDGADSCEYVVPADGQRALHAQPEKVGN